MRLNRFIGQFDFSKGKLTILDEEVLNQVRNVFRMRVGDQFLLGNGEGKEALVELVEYGKNSLEVKILEIHENTNEPQNQVTLYCAVLKKENFELVVQKATEVGVCQIVPIITERTVKLNLRMDRLEKIIKEAAEQSGRAIVPKLEKIKDLEGALKEITGKNVLFDISGQNIQGLGIGSEGSNIGVWIGPEGGWTDNELELAKNAGFSIISLGQLTLRAETAAIIGSFLSTHSLGENKK